MTETHRFTVLVATDFSPTADAAVEWGTELARARGGRVVLVHAVDLHGPLSDFLPSPPDLEEHIQGAAVARLDELAASLRERGVAEVESRLEIGVASQAITQAAVEVAPDLLVQGSRGLTGVAQLLLGSTAQRVVQHAPCPVLTVHPGDRDRHAVLRHILVPTDFSHDAAGAARTARSLLAADGARLTLLHAYHLPVEYTAYGAIPTGLPFQQDVAAIAEEKLAAAAEPLQGDGLRVDTVSREGYPPEVIIETARDLAADVIAMGTHGRTGLRHLLLGSNAERVIGQAPCPVLTVRQPER
jgi:nucleotide-binding universal stress UspA family protein